MGYAEFELDIPEVMRTELPKYFDALAAEPLIEANVAKIPQNAQGAYMLFLNGAMSTLGKRTLRPALGVACLVTFTIFSIAKISILAMSCSRPLEFLCFPVLTLKRC